MSTNDSPLFDGRIADWLEGDPDMAPGQLLATVYAALPSVPQRRRRLGTFVAPAGVALRIGLAAGVVAVIGIVLAPIVSPPTVGPPGPTPTPSMTGGPSLSGEVTTFTSPHYHYTIARPAQWDVREATASLVEGEAPWIDSNGVDYIAAQPRTSTAPGVIVGAAPVSASLTLAEWTQKVTITTCGEPDVEQSQPLDGETGERLEYANCFGLHHIWITVIHEGFGYHIVWIGTLDSPDVDRATFESMVATFRFGSSPAPPSTPASSPPRSSAPSPSS